MSFKSLLGLFLATFLCIGVGYSQSTVDNAGKETGKAGEKAGKETGKAGEKAGKETGKAGEKAGKDSAKGLKKVGTKL